MKRRLRKTLMVASCLVAVCAGVMWTRSARTTDVAAIAVAGKPVRLVSALDCLMLSVWDDDSLADSGVSSLPAPPAPWPVHWKQLLPDLSTEDGFHLQVPYWMFMLAGLVLPVRSLIRHIAWAYREERRLWRQAKGLCTKCGYDMRGSPRQCPECGQVRQKVAFRGEVTAAIWEEIARVVLGPGQSAFGEDVQAAIRYAQEEARQGLQGYVGTEHLLLGILRVGESAGAKRLQAMGVELATLRVELAGLMEPEPGGQAVEDGPVEATPALRRVVDAAREIRRAEGVAHVGTEHLVVAMMAEGEGVGAECLARLRVSVAGDEEPEGAFGDAQG